VIRAVIDTNILIRALIKPQGAVGPVLTALRDGRYTLLYAPDLLDELIEKLSLPRIRLKYHVETEQIEALLGIVALRGEMVTPRRRVKVCRDPDDDMFIEVALEGNAGFVVTGDNDLLILKAYETVRFVTPRDFLNSLNRG
jgi:putative PIN family toxin of toxin-antitoxin system